MIRRLIFSHKMAREQHSVVDLSPDGEEVNYRINSHPQMRTRCASGSIELFARLAHNRSVVLISCNRRKSITVSLFYE